MSTELRTQIYSKTLNTVHKIKCTTHVRCMYMYNSQYRKSILYIHFKSDVGL